MSKGAGMSIHIIVYYFLIQSIFDNLEDEEMRRARTRSNPYETIRGVIFQNRYPLLNIKQLVNYLHDNNNTNSTSRHMILLTPTY